MADAMVKFKQLHPGKSFAGNDGIHPENVGHTVMAYAFLKAMGCDGDIGTITLDLAASKAEAHAGAAKWCRWTDGTVTVSRAPSGRSTSFATATRWVSGRRWNWCRSWHDLNRYTLIVKNGPAGKRLKVTWTEVPGGDADRLPEVVSVSQTFDAGELARGVNLADRFPTTPFAHAWSRLDRAVHAQQDFETPLNKQYLHDQAKWTAAAPSAADAARDLAAAAERLEGELRKASAAAVGPVTYTVKVEAE